MPVLGVSAPLIGPSIADVAGDLGLVGGVIIVLLGVAGAIGASRRRRRHHARPLPGPGPSNQIRRAPGAVAEWLRSGLQSRDTGSIPVRALLAGSE